MIECIHKALGTLVLDCVELGSCLSRVFLGLLKVGICTLKLLGDGR